MNIINKICSDFENYDILYAHFKSNTELDDSFLGKDDFDILVDINKKDQVEKILVDNRAKKFNTVPEKIYPYVSSWLAYDEETGNIYHLHMHCHIVSGKKLLKDYVISWDHRVLETRVKDEKWGIYKTDPSLEIILLATRSVIKSHLSDFCKALIGKYKLHPDLNKERLELIEEINCEEIKKYAESIYDSSELIETFCKKTEFSSKEFLQLNTFIRKKLRKDRRFSPTKAQILSQYNQMKFRMRQIVKGKFGLVAITKKSVPTGGMIVAMVGVDGSGKSTTTRLIKKWLGVQIDCKQVYLGKGDGKTNLFVDSLKKVRSKKKQTATKAGKVNRVKHDEKFSIKRRLRGQLKAIEVISIQKSNYKKLKKMDNLRKKGGICLTDRYPQIEVKGSNDGPKIYLYKRYFNSNLVFHILLRLEKKYLKIVEDIKPDIIFRLNISAETSMIRKPEQKDISIYEDKIKLLNMISFFNSNIIDIDAEQEHDKELMEIKKLIWDNL